MVKEIDILHVVRRRNGVCFEFEQTTFKKVLKGGLGVIAKSHFRFLGAGDDAVSKMGLIQGAVSVGSCPVVIAVKQSDRGGAARGRELIVKCAMVRGHTAT